MKYNIIREISSWNNDLKHISYEFFIDIFKQQNVILVKFNQC